MPIEHCLLIEIPDILSYEQKTKSSPFVKDGNFLVIKQIYSVQCVSNPVMAIKPIIVTGKKLYKF